MPRRRNLPVDPEVLAEKAAEIRDTTKELAGAGSDAVKEFVTTTGSAAKDFAGATAQAAKELLDATEKAVDRLNRRTQPRRRGRKLLRAGLALGAGAAVLANRTARDTITGQVRKLRGGEQPSWQAGGDGEMGRQTPTQAGI